MATLRVGIVLDDTKPPAWIARVIRDLRASDDAQLAFAVIVPGWPRRATLAIRAMWRSYRMLDRRGRSAADPFQPTDVSAALAGIPTAAAPVDVVIRLATAPVSPELAALAARGVWSFVFDTDPAIPPGFDDVLHQQPATRSSLEERNADGTREVLYESWAMTDPISVRRHNANLYWKTSSFVARALRQQVHRRRSTSPDDHVTATADVATGLTRLVGKLLHGRARRLIARDQWTLGYHLDPATTEAPNTAFDTFCLLEPTIDRFWADPFVVPDGDGWVVLFEEKIYARPRAHISALRIDRNGDAGPAEPVLECEYHLSYPFMLDWQGEHWMIPETARNRTIEMWRASEFPRRWKREHVLIDNISAVDATVFEHDGSFWMFCNMGEPHASREEELHVFHARSPLGPWTPHCGNPVKSDIRGARPAGRPFRIGGVLYRPAQDGSHGYGSSVRVHRIDRLDPSSYLETEVTRYLPNWKPGLSGLHTVNACPGLTIIDVCVAHPRFRRR